MCLEQAGGMSTWRHPASAPRRLRIYFYSNSWKQEGAFLKKAPFEPDGVSIIFVFEKLIEIRQGEGSIAPEIPARCICQGGHILILGQKLSLESCHLTGGICVLCNCATSNNPAQRRVLCQAVRVIDIFVTGNVPKQ